MPCIIHHTQLLSTKLRKILGYLKNDVNIIVEKVQQNQNCQIIEPSTEKT